MSNVLTTAVPAASIPFQPLACSAGKSMEFRCDWAGTDEYVLNLNNAGEQGVIDMVQTIWIDNKDCNQKVDFEIDGSGQVIRFPASSQGYVPILAQNPVKLTISAPSTPGQITRFIIMNFRTQPYIWSV